VIAVITNERSYFTYPYIIIVQPTGSRVKSVLDLYCCWLLSC